MCPGQSPRRPADTAAIAGTHCRPIHLSSAHVSQPKITLRPFRCLSSVLSLALLLVAGSAVTEALAGGRICTSNDTFMFGSRSVGSSATATATVTNCGDAPWSFTDVSVHPATGPAFRVSTTCTTGLTLAPGATCTVSVRFAPTTPG